MSIINLELVKRFRVPACAVLRARMARAFWRLSVAAVLLLTALPMRSSQGQGPQTGAEAAAAKAESTGGPADTQEAASTIASKNPNAGGISTHPMEIMAQMGGWLVPFLIASVISLWFGIERLVVLRRNRVIPRAFVDRFLQHLEENKLDPAAALELCAQTSSPVAAVFAHGIRKWGKPSVEVEQAIIDGGERQVSQLRKHLRVLNGVATVTPLLGLLGTVIGMIQAFNDIASAGAMGRADQLAVGIALALLTTAFGLAIAIPSLIMYMYLAGRVDALVMEMDLLAQNVVNLISAEALAGRQSTPLRPHAVGSAKESKKAI